MTDVFAEARRLVSAREVAEMNGLHPNRAGFICCPFHHEKTASLKLYENGTWYCFGCRRGGSSIDFAAALYNLSALDSVRRLNEDFRLGLPLDRDRPLNRAERAAAQHRREICDIYELFEKWREKMLLQLNTAYRTGHLALRDKHPDAWTDAEVLAVQWMPALEDWADALDGSPAEQLAIFRNREGVGQLCDRILANKNLKKSGAA